MGATPSSSLWRPCPFKTYTPQRLRNEIKEIQSESKTIRPGKYKRIVVCGCVGAGKSSTINNIISALEDKYTKPAGVASGTEHATHKCTEYKMFIGKFGKAEDLFYTLCDTPGLTEPNEDLNKAIIKAIIEGKFRSGDTVDFENLTVEGLKDMTAIQPKAVCVIFVISARKVMLTEDKKSRAIDESSELDVLKPILMLAQALEIKTACLLTKCDELDDDVKRNVKKIYYSRSVETARLVIERNFNGFPEDRIFPIVNYTKNLETNANMMVHTLFALKNILNDINSNVTRTVS